MNDQFVTKQKYSELQEELRVLQKETIPMIARRIDEAKLMGDLSENAEYHAAREEMSWANGRLEQIEELLRNAQIISENVGIGTVSIGNTIIVRVGDAKKTFRIVGAEEADPLDGKISNESPLGQALLGKKLGDVVEFEVPAGVQHYEILKIT